MFPHTSPALALLLFLAVQGACEQAGTTEAQEVLKKGSRLGPSGIGLLFLGPLTLLLIPLLLLLCKCGPAVMAGAFTEIPIEQLIAYHTEGQGEDRDVPVVDVVDNGRIGYSASKGVGGMRIMGAGGAAGAGFMDSTYTMGGRGYNDMEMSFMRRSEILSSRVMAMGGDFDGMAAPDMFLDEYYSQRSRGMEDGFAKNEPMVYDYEGNGSPVGSVGCCSILEDNNDLEFLNDLGPKFTTLAEICGGKKAEVPTPLPPPPKPIVDNTVVVSSSSIVITLLVQSQPSTELLTERPAVGHNMYVLNSGPVAEKVVVQGANIATNTLSREERMVLVDRGAPAQAGMLHAGNLSGSQMLLVDGGATSGEALQGTLQRGVTGSQGLMVMEGQGGHVIQLSLKQAHVCKSLELHVIDMLGHKEYTNNA